MRMIVIKELPNGLHRYEVEQNGFFDTFKGLVTVRYVTRDFLRNVLRDVFTSGKKPYLLIQRTEGGRPHAYEGLKPDFWQEHEFSCTMNQAIFYFRVEEIDEAQVF